MTIFIDANFKCYTTAAEGRRTFEIPFFNGKCTAFVEGYRFVPDGEIWTRPDGMVFAGEMLSPAVDYSILAAAQRQFEADMEAIVVREAALAELGVTSDD